MYKAELVVPFTGDYIRQTLVLARADSNSLVFGERDWAEQQHPLFYAECRKNFDQLHRLTGPDTAWPYFTGTYLGHYAARLCAKQEGGVDGIIANYKKNLDADKNYSKGNDRGWNTTQELDLIFGDPDLSAAFMNEITNAKTRTATALAVGFLCLKQLPPSTALQ